MWKASYNDKNGKTQHIGYYDTQEAAAHAVNAAVRRLGLQGRRRTNPVVDGQLVPRARKANGHGKKALRKRCSEESAAAAEPVDAAPVVTTTITRPRKKPRRYAEVPDAPASRWAEGSAAMPAAATRSAVSTLAPAAPLPRAVNYVEDPDFEP